MALGLRLGAIASSALLCRLKSDTTGSAIVSHQSLKILHISDLHLSGNDDEKVDFIRSITDQDYDLVFLTGDVFEFLDGLKYGPKLAFSPAKAWVLMLFLAITIIMIIRFTIKL
jgi:predicted MPP superfamily phosphohydrolase